VRARHPEGWSSQTAGGPAVPLLGGGLEGVRVERP
jgi:hypothetical protein